MSRDSSATYVHMHSSRLADLFEEFCRPPSSSNGPAGTNHPNPPSNGNPSTANNNNANGNDPSHTQLPGHFLPFEEIHLPPHLMPLNPEDEDGVVPDMHAAFGINRALGQGHAAAGGGAAGGDGQHAAGGEMSSAGAQQEPAWRDLGLERLLDRGPAGGGGVDTGGRVPDGAGAAAGAGATTTAARREGRRTGILLRR